MKSSQQRTNRMLYILNLGFFAGLIWGGVKVIFYYLGFTKVIPGFLAEPFYAHTFLNSWNGHFIGWLFFIVFSILASIVYLLLFSKVRGPWMGMGYGLFWWALIYLLIGPMTGMVKRVDKLDWNSISSDACLFLLWGLFIGYSVALEFTEERMREPFNNFKAEKGTK